jgi:hypothetical protein
MADTKIEYRVKRITRYVITKHEESLCGRIGSTIEKGTYDNADIAYEVAYALCKQDHERLGYGPGDERIIYPNPVNNAVVTGGNSVGHVGACLGGAPTEIIRNSA